MVRSMTPATLLSELTARGVEFVADGDKLRFRPADQVMPDEVALIRQHKATLLKLLAPEPWPIIEGTERFSLWVSDDSGAPWPEFVPGVHFDIRQPSRLRPLCSPIEDRGEGIFAQKCRPKP